MKSILTFICIVSGFVVAHAQKFELGLLGGGSTTAIPQKSLYTGDKAQWCYTTGIQFHYNSNSYLQVGGEVGMTRWERNGDWKLSAASNQNLGSKNVNFVLAERAVNIALRANFVFPFYSQYEDFVRSNIYIGVSAGGIVTGNNGNIEYSRYNPNTPTEYSYVSKYNYESGYGTMLGIQLGGSYYFSKLLGVNVEVAPKMAWVNTIDSRYAYANDNFNIIYLPISLGLKFRFGEVYH